MPPAPDATRASATGAAALLRFLDRFLPTKLDRSDEDRVFRARVCIGFTFFVAIVGLLPTTLHIALGIYSVAIVLGVASLLALAIPFVLRRTGRLNLAVHLGLANLYALLIFCSAVSGGLLAPALQWNMALIIGALLMAGTRAGIFWTTLVVIEVVIFYLIDRSGIPLPGLVPEEDVRFLHFPLTVALVIVVCSLTWLYESLRNTALLEIERSNERLAEANRDLEVARDRAEAAGRAKATFLANMSHEIRTPMNAVIGMTSLLSGRELGVEERDYVDSIRSSGEHLLSLINDILDFSKIEAGKLELEQCAFDLRTLMEESVDLVALDTSRKGLELTCFVDPSLQPRWLGDPGRIRQVLVNLLSNAVKFTQSGEVEARVEAGEQGMLSFSVRDTGIGIPPERRDRLFQPFSQVDASTTRQYGGTGLGLVVSRRLCELMGGHIEALSEPGEGSTFSFTIRAGPAPGTTTDPSRMSRLLAGMRALVVDDNATNRRILVAYTRTWNMTATEVASGAEALACFEGGESFDVTLLDFHMPKMDGLTLAAELRERYPDVCGKILLLSSIDSGSAEARERNSEIDGCLVKPIKPSQLQRLLAETLLDETTVPRAAETPPAQAETLAELHPLRLLLAEDNALNQKVALGMLESIGYRADVAGNGREVLEALERQRYDVIFMDVQMPEMDGITATHEITARFAPDERPWIIAMTANAMVGDRERYLEAGMQDYVPKPIRTEDLVSALGRFLDPTR